MKRDYEIRDLEEWDLKIRERVEEFGLDCYPQQFDICDHNQMLGYMAYSGAPSHYPHWSYGKGYEKLKTLYDYGVSGLPYEMVINSNPALAYLMRDNSLLLQVLTIAHVYGHNDFFKNNFTFKSTRAEYTIDTFKAHSDRIRAYIEDPSIGLQRVENLIDAAHAISLQCRRNLAIRKLSPEEQREYVMQKMEAPNRAAAAHDLRPGAGADIRKIPAIPEDDLLLFIRDNNPYLATWEKDILTIVHEEAQYFMPQIETKIMNEGWASYWHKCILDSINLPQDMQLEFIVNHNQVIRPFPQGINPYHLGFRIWEDIYRRYEKPTPQEERELEPSHPNGREKIFSIREADRDASFLRRHLTKKLMTDLNLFEYETKGDQKVISNLSDDEGWKAVKETLIKNTGMNAVPVIKVEDADFGQNHTLHLVHYHDGRDLQLEYAERTLCYVSQLWQRDVALETTLDGKRYLLLYNDHAFSTKALR